MNRILACLVALMVVVGFAVAQTRVLAPGDKVRLTCEEEPSLNRDYTVTKDGFLLLTFVGAVQVSGLTPEDAAKRISDELVSQRILGKANVVLALQASETRPVRFAGAVRLAGEAPWTDGMKLSDVIKIAQPTAGADLSRVTIESSIGLKSVVDATAGADPLLQSGDAVFFPVYEKAREVQVLGGVARPGVIAMGEGLTVRQAIEAAGGFAPLGDSTRVRIEREGAAPRTVSSVDVGGDEVLKPGDRLVVELRPTRRFVTLSGAVAKPGVVEFNDGLTLAVAIDRVGGLNEGANDERVVVVRGQGKQAKRITVDLKRIRAGRIGDFALLPGDLIQVAGPKNRGDAHLRAAAGVLGALLVFGR